MIDLTSLLTADIVVAAGVVLVATGALILVAVPARPRVRWVAGEDHVPARAARHRASERDATTRRMTPVAALPAASAEPGLSIEDSIGLITAAHQVQQQLREQAIRDCMDLTMPALVRPLPGRHAEVSTR